MRPTSRLAVLSATACLATLALPHSASATSSDAARAAAVAPMPSPTASCSVSAPPVVTTNSATVSVTVALRHCPLGSRATWRLVAPSGKDVARVSLTGRGQTLSIPTADASAIGRYRFVPVSGSDAENGLMYLTPGAMVVKSGSRLSASIGRKTVTVRAARFDQKAKALRPWSGAVTTLEKRACPATTCRWQKVRSVRTSAQGRAVLPRPAAGATYRVTTGATASIAGRTLAIKTR